MEALIDPVMKSLVSLLALVIGGVVSYLTKLFKDTKKKREDKDDLPTIEKVAYKMVEHVEKEWDGEESEDKFNAAIGHVATMLQSYGVKASDELIKSSIQEGWRAMDNAQKKDDK